MITISTRYDGSLRTTARHIRSGNMLITDAPVDNQGKGEAFSPTDLLAASLGSCMLTLMGITANTHGFSIDNTSIEITKVMASAPRRVSEVKIEFFMPPNSFTDHQKKILENAARTCPVALSIHPDIKQELVFHYAS